MRPARLRRGSGGESESRGEGRGDGCLEDEFLRARMRAAAALRGEVPAVLSWAASLSTRAPRPGQDTVGAWELLASLATVDVGLARIVEPQFDAVAILSQAPDEVPLARVGVTDTSTWGVYAAEGPDAPLAAVRDGERWLLDGVKPWCSLAKHVSHALVTARLDHGSRQLFAVDMRGPGVRAEEGPWVARGLQDIVSAPVRFERAPAVPVGPPGWYLRRPGFFWGGIGVAACWWGGAIGVARAVYAAARRREPDQIALLHLGAIDLAITGARAALRDAAERIDDPRSPSSELPALMLRTRSIVADAVEATLAHAAHALGPGPLALDEDHARRVADLQLYVRQHHAERDLALLGRELLADADGAPW